MNRKTTFIFALLFSFIFISAFTLQNPQGEVCIKVKNDTGGSVTLHTGKGTAPMNNGVTKEFCMEEGSKLYYADKGQKGDLIIEFTSDMNGKTIKLSDY